MLFHASRNGPLLAAAFRSLHVVRCAPGGIAGFNAQLFLTTADLPALLVALICLTGLEPDCAKALSAECLSSPSAGFVTLAYDKKRAHSAARKTLRVRDGDALRSAGRLIRLVVSLTEPARALVGTEALWAGASTDGPCAFFEGDYELSSQLRSSSARHRFGELVDRSGEAVRLDLRRLRKSAKSRASLASGGVLDHFAAGHTKAVAASRYGDIDAHRELHDQAVEDGLGQALEVALAPAVVATESGAELPSRRAWSPLGRRAGRRELGCHLPGRHRVGRTAALGDIGVHPVGVGGQAHAVPGLGGLLDAEAHDDLRHLADIGVDHLGDGGQVVGKTAPDVLDLLDHWEWEGSRYVPDDGVHAPLRRVDGSHEDGIGCQLAGELVDLVLRGPSPVEGLGRRP